MKIIIKETGEKDTFSIIDPKTGVNFSRDFIGSYGALEDGQFVYDENQDAYVCDNDTYEWWHQVLSDHQKLNERIAALTEKNGYDAVQEAISGIDVELEYEAAAYNKALDEAFNDRP